MAGAGWVTSRGGYGPLEPPWEEVCDLSSSDQDSIFPSATL